MNVQKRNGVSIYCLSAGAAIPEWLGDRARRNLSKTNESIRRRVELLQDFAMPASSSKLVQSNDGRYIIATGTYPPRIRCYDVHELAMKFERYIHADIIDTVLLGDDYGKQALLLGDRTIAFHAHYGAHESIRIPTFGRAMTYEPSTCELLIAAKGNYIYRINLDEGRFSDPWDFNNTNSTNHDENNTNNTQTSGTSIAVHPRHALCAVGCDDGIVRFWDSRVSDSSLQPFLKLDVSTALSGLGYSIDHQDQYIHSSGPVNEISSIAYDTSGLYMAAGTGGGLVALYDVRSSRPLHVQEHKHGSSIHTVRFHSSSGMILSSDEKLIKVWRYKSSAANDIRFTNEIDRIENDTTNTSLPTNDSSAVGSIKVNIEGSGKFTHFIVAGDEKDPTGERSGLILCATDQPKMDSFYVPAIGVAPNWCSYLENITEELEERDLKRDGSGIDTEDLLHSGQETVFENYKFVTRDELEKLGISNLIGTPMLRGYMNGFFMDLNMYTRVRAVANPFEYEEYQKKKLKERLAAKQSSRIAPRNDPTKKNSKPKVAVNPDLADRLTNKATSDSTKAGKVAKGLLSDNRFGGLFTNPDFEIDHDDTEFKLRNPSGLSAKNKRNNLDSDSENDDDDDDEENNDKNDINNDATSDDNDDNDKDEQYSENDFDNNMDDGDDETDSDEDDGLRSKKVRGEAYADMKRTERKLQEQRKKERTPNNANMRTKRPVMEEEDDYGGNKAMAAIGLGLGDASAQAKAQRRRQEMNLPIAKRKAIENEEIKTKPQIRMVGGTKEAVYYPKSSSNRNKNKER